MARSIRILLILFFLGVCWTTSAYPQDQPNYYAVIIGVSQFTNLPNEEWLGYADADAKDFYSFITSPRGRAFPPENVFLLTNAEASYSAVRNRLGTTLSRKVKAGDTVYIFIATHGMVEKDAAREAYLLTNDSDREDLYSSALPMKELGNIIQARLKNAGRIILFADACRSGKLGQFQGSLNRYIEDVSKQRGETMGLLASRPNEFSREGKQFGNGHGAFSYYLLKGLMGDADADKDKTVTAAEIISYLQVQVEIGTDKQQHVRDFGDFAADTPLSFIDKAGPELKLTSAAAKSIAEIASLSPLQVINPVNNVTRDALKKALVEGRLVSPAGNNAWEIYEYYSRLSVSQADKDVAKDDVVIALASAGEKLLAAYRRGDQVVALDAAKYSEGAQLFTNASRIEPDDVTLQAKARFFSGRFLVETRAYSEGIAQLREAVKLDPDAAYPYNALGIAYMAQERWNDATANFKLASDRAEKWIYPRYNLARVYTAQKRYKEAEQEFKKGIELETQLGLKYAYLHYNQGILFLYQGRTNEAEQQFRQAAAMKPDDAMSYHNLGLVSERKGDNSRAEGYFQKAAELDKKLVAPRLKLAEIYRNQRKQDLRETVLREAAAAQPGKETLEPLGQFFLESSKLEDAEQTFVLMLAASPSDALGASQALSGLGDVHGAQGKWDNASQDYQQAISRTTDKDAVRALQKKLNRAQQELQRAGKKK